MTWPMLEQLGKQLQKYLILSTKYELNWWTVHEISTQQAPANDDTGMIPDNMTYDIRLHDIIFSYPSRPDLMVSY